MKVSILLDRSHTLRTPLMQYVHRVRCGWGQNHIQLQFGGCWTVTRGHNERDGRTPTPLANKHKKQIAKPAGPGTYSNVSPQPMTESGTTQKAAGSDARSRSSGYQSPFR